MTTSAFARRILLTGAAGFIGSNVLKYLFEKYPKYSFVVLDALTYCGDIKNIPEKIHKARNFRFVYGDVRNQRVVEHLV
ncbi:MAG: GDP-mannose 4,6-dehydratase, partial [Parcubacteria group bacterium]|nr:GDP-mannose 4,6-dehydratase [Parcubacteria group bacterium]